MKILIEGVILGGMMLMEAPCKNHCGSNCMVDCDLKLPFGN